MRDCTAVDNLGDGIILDGSGGVATSNVASFNGGYGISLPYGTATGNTVVLNKSFGISALCPSTIVGNTIVASEFGSIDTNRPGCVLANNATRPWFTRGDSALQARMPKFPRQGGTRFHHERHRATHASYFPAQNSVFLEAGARSLPADRTY